MATTADLEGHICRAATAADRLFEALEEIEPAEGLASALAARKPKSRAEVLGRLRSARNPLEAVFRIGRPRPGRRHMNIR
ncbi:MAG: hypothetical protein JO252_27925 [Planctomycetaceae bacterium]|nr:hypothetical protein [Planctomycetaceae bacterium]